MLHSFPAHFIKVIDTAHRKQTLKILLKLSDYEKKLLIYLISYGSL